MLLQKTKQKERLAPARAQSQAQFGAYVASGTVLNNYAHIFDLLIRRDSRDSPGGGTAASSCD